jgi:hypothetical protein
MKKVFLILWILLGNLHVLLAQGILEGTVTDKDTKEPVIGASISIEKLKVGILSDEEGRFLLKNLTPGTYQVFVKSIGYKTEIRYEVLIQGGVNQIRFELEASGKELEGVEIVASPFTRTEENPISIKTIGIEQIRSTPGGNFDISKVVQALPGVSGALGFRNDIIVRGGAPNENVYYLDGIEIPILNHFQTQGSSGGAQGILNVSFIEELKLSSSALDARYDNALASTFVIKQRDGNHDRLSSYHLVHALSKAIQEESIVWHADYAERKVLTFNNNFFAFEHGDVNTKNSLLVYATEFSEDWGNTKFRTLYTGHYHKKKTIEYITEDEITGFSIKIIPSLSKTDYWHYHNKFIGSKRAAIIEVHDYDNGKIGEFVYNCI